MSSFEIQQHLNTVVLEKPLLETAEKDENKEDNSNLSHHCDITTEKTRSSARDGTPSTIFNRGFSPINFHNISVLRSSPALSIVNRLDSSVSSPSSRESSFVKKDSLQTSGSDSSKNDIDEINESEGSDRETPEDHHEADEKQETEEEKLLREQRESEQLAWEMIRQENMEIYQMQMQFMQENSKGMSAEDLEAIQMAVRESVNNFNTSTNRESVEGENSAIPQVIP